jgi:hypothetical protein
MQQHKSKAFRAPLLCSCGGCLREMAAPLYKARLPSGFIIQLNKPMVAT